MPKSSVVFITNRSPSHNYSPAESWGSLRFITQGNYPVFKTDRLQEEIIEALIHSKETDYLLLSGLALICALSLTVWLELHGSATVLLWDAADEDYVDRYIQKSSLRLQIEQIRDRQPARPS